MLIVSGCRSGDAKAAAHRLLSAGLRTYFGLEKPPEIARGPLGKPWFPACPHIHFNLSHSEGYALCALSDSPVGVDIETVRPRSPRLPARVLNEAEYRWFKAQGGSWEAFYTLWTRKESWCKYAGKSVARPRLVCPPLPGGQTGSPAVHSFSGDGWRGALCTVERETPPILWCGAADPGAGVF